MPKQGEIFWVNLDPAQGIESKKMRPCLVMNSTSHYKKLMIVAPLLKWKPMHGTSPFFIRISPTVQNKLDSDRTADVFQMRAVDISRRFGKKNGILESSTMEQILVAARLLFT